MCLKKKCATTIDMHQSLEQLNHNSTLLVTKHGCIQNPGTFFKASDAFGVIVCLHCGVYDTKTSNEYICFFLSIAIDSLYFEYKLCQEIIQP